MTTWQKSAQWGASLLFLVFAILQWNDPDPLQWMALYGGMALLFFLLALGKSLARKLALFLAFVSLFFMVRLLPQIGVWIKEGMPSLVQSMKASQPTIEYTREFLGLALCFLASLFGFFQKKST